MTMVAKGDIRTFRMPSSPLYRAVKGWVLFIQALFRSNPRGTWKWHPADENSEIIISAAQPTSTTSGNEKPVIVVERFHARDLGVGRDRMVQMDTDGTSKCLARVMSTPIRITVVAREEVEAEDIIWYIFAIYPFFLRELHLLGRLHSIDLRPVVSKPMKHTDLYPDSSVPDWMAVTMDIECTIQYTAEIESSDETFLQVLHSVKMQVDQNGSNG